MDKVPKLFRKCASFDQSILIGNLQVFLITWYIFNVFFSTKSLLFSDFTTQFHFNLDSELKIDCEQFGPIFISVTKA